MTVRLRGALVLTVLVAVILTVVNVLWVVGRLPTRYRFTVENRSPQDLERVSVAKREPIVTFLSIPNGGRSVASSWVGWPEEEFSLTIDSDRTIRRWSCGDGWAPWWRTQDLEFIVAADSRNEISLTFRKAESYPETPLSCGPPEIL